MNSSRLMTFGIIGAVILAIVFAFSFSGDDVTAQNEEGLMTLQRGNSNEPSSLDPHRASGTWENNIIGDMFVGLYTEDAEANPILGAAESHTVSEDGLTHTFIIREGHVWSDGKPVTAYDFEFALRRILNPAMAAEYAAILYIIDNAAEINSGALTDVAQLGVHALNARTLEINLTRPAPFLPQLLTHYTTFAVPMHAVEEFGDQWTRPENFVSNGAYVLENWIPNDHITVVKNPLFFDADNVAIDRVNFYATDDASSALRRFRAGELDSNSDFPSQQYEWLQENMPAETRTFPYIATSYIAVNTIRPPFDDIRIRRALAMAIDRDTIAYEILKVGQTPAYTLVPPLIPNYTPPEADFASDTLEERIEAAKALMRDAGYGPDNLLQFVYRYRESVDNRRAAVAVARFWTEIYVDVDLVNTETATHYDDMRAGNFALGDAGWVADYADPENYLFLVDSNSGQLNYGNYSNPEYDALLAQASQTSDLLERAEILASAERIIMHDMPLIPTTYGVSKALVGQQVVGWVDNALNIHRTRYMTIDESQRTVRPSMGDQIMRWFN